MQDRMPPKAPRPIIKQLWSRSRAFGVPAAPERLPLYRVSRFELQARLDLNRNLLAAARPRLDSYSQQLQDASHVLYVVDSDGIVLHAAGDVRLRKAFGISPGYDWSERRMGTNGAGTALATGQPVAVHGEEHYCALCAVATCIAAPVLGAFGRVIGAIDLTTRVEDALLDRLPQVIQLANEIGEQVMCEQKPRRPRARRAGRSR